MRKDKSIEKRISNYKKLLTKIMMFGVVILASAIMFMQKEDVSAAKKKAKQAEEILGGAMSLRKGVLTIKGKGDMGDAVKITVYEGKNIRKVVVEEGVVSLLDSAFEGCKKLKKVTLPNSLKKLE